MYSCAQTLYVFDEQERTEESTHGESLGSVYSEAYGRMRTSEEIERAFAPSKPRKFKFLSAMSSSEWRLRSTLDMRIGLLEKFYRQRGSNLPANEKRDIEQTIASAKDAQGSGSRKDM